MKNKFFTFFVLLFVTTLIASTSFGQYKACFTDDGGITWHFDNIVSTGEWTYYGEGTADNAYPETKATMWLDFSAGASNGTVEIHGANAFPDGCNFYSDSFVYVGSATWSRATGSSVYTGSGTWTSYCFGAPLFAGTWAASGPCGSAKIGVKPGVKPFQSKQSADDFSIKVSPNPVKDYARIEYKVAAASKVSITVYDVNGLAIKTLVSDSKAAGTHTISWNMLNRNGSKVPSGIYKITAVVNGKPYVSNLQVL